MKARIQIGKRTEKKVKATIAWKDWERKEGKYPVMYVFYPRKYPSYSIIFETEEYMVRRSLGREIINELKKAGWDYRKETLFVVVEKEGYFIEWEGNGGYEKREWGLKRKEKKEEEEEELDIEF